MRNIYKLAIPVAVTWSNN